MTYKINIDVYSAGCQSRSSEDKRNASIPFQFCSAELLYRGGNGMGWDGCHLQGGPLNCQLAATHRMMFPVQYPVKVTAVVNIFFVNPPICEKQSAGNPS